MKKLKDIKSGLISDKDIKKLKGGAAALLPRLIGTQDRPRP